jgi:hypothetical protein
MIEAAIDGFEVQKQRIDAQIAELREMLNGSHESPAAAKKRAMSAAGRKAIAEAQRKRWAAKKVESVPKAAKKPKRKLSAAGRANIVAALTRRWAAKKAATGTPPASAIPLRSVLEQLPAHKFRRGLLPF